MALTINQTIFLVHSYPPTFLTIHGNRWTRHPDHETALRWANALKENTADEILDLTLDKD